MFSDWLNEQLRKKDWQQADLARASKLTTASISKYMAGRIPDKDALKKIAKAFYIPPEQVFIAAGLLSADADEDPWVEEMSHKLSLLSPRVREIAGKIINAMAEGEGEPNNKPKTKTATR